MSRSRRSRQDGFRPKLIALSVAACFSFSAAQSLANPTGGTVASGSASFAASGNTLTVTNSANAIINWQGFSIGVNDITRFLQPSAASAVLNRVLGSGGVIPQSVIDGVLSSNGRVFLLNQSGVVIGATASIDVAGLVVSSLNLSDDDFLNGRMHFTEVPGAGKVSNAGIIDTSSSGPGGRVFLVGPDVENSGVIRTPQGQIVLAAGKSVDLVSENSPFVTVKVTADSEQALNLGTLAADSGRIDMAAALVRNTGMIAANSAVVGSNGDIRLVATKDVTLDAGSSTTANGPSGGNVLIQAQTGTALVYGNVQATGSAGAGGTVQALGVRVGVIGSGVIDASGDTGGGTVLVGGDAHGANPDVQNAQQTLIGPDGIIRADAQTTGDGGRVVVWSDQYTQFYGNVSARGGAQSGNGGFVETSGATLNASGSVNTSAPNGTTGTWLLDPDDITISAYGLIPLNTIPCSAVQVGLCFDDNPGTTSDVSIAAINAGLMSNSVTLQAHHDITLQTDLTLTYGGQYFVADAGNNINLGNFNIVTSGTHIILSANDAGAATGLGFAPSPSGTGSIASGLGFGNITTYGGWISLSGVGVQVGNLNTSGGLSGSNSVQIDATSGNIVTGAITTASTVPGFSGSSVNLTTTGGNIVVNGTIDTRGASGDSTTASGGWGGNVTLWSPTAASVYGSIVTSGGNGATDPSGQGGSGGSAGGVLISGTTQVYGCPDSCGFFTVPAPLSGDILVTGNIDTHGGIGASATVGSFAEGGAGGSGGNVTLLADASHSVTVTGGLLTSGGSGGFSDTFFSSYTTNSLDHAGGKGGDITLAGGTISTGAITANGGTGGDGGEGGFGGAGGALSITAGTSVATGSIDTSGGNGGQSDSIVTACCAISSPFGGNGGSVSIYGAVPITISGTLTTRGGDGGAGVAEISNGVGGPGGAAGAGGAVYLDGTGGAVQVGAINAFGGSGGSGGSVYGTSLNGGLGGGGGGAFGGVTIYGGSISTGAILAYGGAGGAGGDGAYASGLGGYGGFGEGGGSVQLFSGSSITVSGVIDASGGGGGNGGAYGGTGGQGGFDGLTKVTLSAPGAIDLGGIYAYGGLGGSGTGSAGGLGAGHGGDGGEGGAVSINGGSIASSGPILAFGAAGGAGGAGDSTAAGGNGGSGGNGESVTLTVPQASGGNLSVTGAVDISGGAGGAAGADGGFGPGAAGLAGIASSVTMTGDAITWIADSISDYSITATSLFNWYPVTVANPISLDAGFFGGISAPLIRVGGGTTSGSITVAGPIALGTENLSLVTNGGFITQTAGSTISAAGLNAYGGSVTLSEANSITNLQGRTPFGDFAFTNTGAISIGAVDAAYPAGISAGTGYGAILSAGGGVTQSAPVNLDHLSVTSGGNVTLTNAANRVAFVDSGAAAGSFTLTSANQVNPAATALSANGNIALTNTLGGGSWNLGNVISYGGGISLVSDNFSVTGSASAATSFSWAPITASSSIGVGPATFSGISAPAVTLGNSSMTGNIALTGALNLGAVGTLNLITGGSGQVYQSSTGDSLAVTNLSVTGGGDVNFLGSNNVANLSGVSQAGSFYFNDNAALNITAPTSAAGAMTLLANGALNLGGAVIAGTTLMLQAAGDVTSSVSGTSAVQGADVSLFSTGGALGSALAPIEVRALTHISPFSGLLVAGNLSAGAANGMYLNTNSYAPEPVNVLQLQNLTSGDIVLNAHGGAITRSLVSNPGGNVTINTFSPLDVQAGINAGDNIFLSTAGALPSGSPPNDMSLNGPFTYGSTGALEVTIGAGGKLNLFGSFPPLVLTSELFPNPLNITKFTFIGFDPLSNPDVLQGVATGIDGMNLAGDFGTGTPGDEDDKKGKGKDISACK